MIYRVEVLPQAGKDIRRIYVNIQAAVSHEAAAWFNGLQALLGRLDQNPLRGSVTPENAELRELSYGRPPRAYRIVYRVDPDRALVSVLHIRHGARDRFGRADLR